MQQDVVVLQRRADYLLNVITQISRINNESWTMAIGLFDVEDEKNSERQSPQCDHLDQQEEQSLLNEDEDGRHLLNASSGFANAEF